MRGPIRPDAKGGNPYHARRGRFSSAYGMLDPAHAPKLRRSLSAVKTGDGEKMVKLHDELRKDALGPARVLRDAAWGACHRRSSRRQ
jgi:hypothetical protein